MRIAVFGASGFVGSTLVERLLAQNHEEIRVCIHSSGNAWRLARRHIPFHIVNILASKEIRSVLQGCTHVVNCTRSLDDNVMLKGLRNLLQECCTQGIQRFIHVSSVAVYGDPPPPESQHEEAPAHPAPQSYGWIKLKQDKLVQQAHQQGLSSIILCPPNISGIYSPYVKGVLTDMRKGTLALSDGGESVINLVDVENLCYAIELALISQHADGQRIFVTDAERITWKAFTDMLMPLAERNEPLPQLPREAIVSAMHREHKPSLSLWRAMKHLVSSGVREALREDPLLEKIDHVVRGSIDIFPKGVETFLRHTIEGPIQIAKVDTSHAYTSPFNAQQLRGVYHACERAERLLGYKPRYSFKESMERFSAWYKAMHGFDTEDWPLIRELEVE